MSTNYFMLPDHGGHVGSLTFHGTFAGRPEPVMKWFQTTYWNYFRQNAELAGKFQRKSKDKYGRKVEGDAPQGSSQYILAGILVPIVVSNDPVDDREWVPFSQITDDAFKALKNNAVLVRLRPLTSRQADKLIHLSDFLTMYHEKHPEKDLSRISVPQASQMCAEWDAELLRIKEEEALKAGTHLLYTHDNGATLWLLSAVEAVKREGERLGNCLASNSQNYLSNSGALMVVRDVEKHSLAAAQFKIKMGFDGKVVQCMDAMQFYGRGNSSVPADAVKVMDAAAKVLDWRSWDDPTLPFTSFNDAKYDAEELGEGEDEDEEDNFEDEDMDVGGEPDVPAATPTGFRTAVQRALGLNNEDFDKVVADIAADREKAEDEESAPKRTAKKPAKKRRAGDDYDEEFDDQDFDDL